VDDPSLGFSLETALMSNPSVKNKKMKQRRWYMRRDVLFCAVIGALLMTYYAWGFIEGPSRITNQLQAKIQTDEEITVNIKITSNFPAQEFHMGIFQEVGTIRDTKGNDTILFKVKPSDIRMLSRKYWINLIDLAP
jgi:hypothetical protein